MILSVTNLFGGYGPIEVLKDINLTVRKGEVVCLVGANGAGKSTLLRMISGLLHCSRGELFFDGEAITKREPNDIVRRGLSHVPEGRQIFSTLTVRQNLILGAYSKKLKKEEEGRLLSSVFKLFPVLEKRLLQKGGTLSGGEQQMLAIGRALMSQPKLLLPDEPSLGLAPLVVDAILGTIKGLRSRGISILLVEQNVTAALGISDRAYVIETGRIVMEGEAPALLRDDEIRKRYLGM